MKNSTLWTIVALVVIIGAGSALAYHYTDKDKTNEGDQVACTMEAKLCPDGSYVGRQGPNCEFAQCPSSSSNDNGGSSTSTTGSAKIGQTIVVNGISITPNDVTSDSRCPSDVKCIWAGNINMHAKLTVNSSTTMSSFSIGTSFVIAGKKVTLTGVTPGKISSQTIKNSDYRFTFTVVAAK
jgi:hypothetical protein